MATTNFRPDLQGLRAIAVLMVLMFHFDVPGASGGFAGVDVFFVLSGYLMTRILSTRQNEPGFVLVKSFLLKRFWRIAPAYYLVTTATVIGGWFFLLPNEYVKLAHSAFAALPFASNIYFKSQAGYFAEAAYLKPLLHTWSLGVEMQFYLIWPLAYIFVRRFSLKLQAGILICTIILSATFCFLLSSGDQEFVFFYVFTRIWQFAAGGLLANAWIAGRINGEFFGSSMVQSAAVISLVASTYLFSDALQWPFPWAIVPTIATMAIIAAHADTPETRLPATKILSWPPLVKIGEISYSLYLVHWPIVCFSAVFAWPEYPAAFRLVGFLISFPLAWALFKFVENPVRARFKARPIVSLDRIVVLGPLAITVIIASVIATSSGLPTRYPVNIRAALSDLNGLSGPLGEAANCSKDSECPEGGETKKSIFLWGDSHAEQFAPALESISRRDGWQMFSQMRSACPPGPDLSTVRVWAQLWENENAGCKFSNKRAFEEIKKMENLRLVILAARWSYYAHAGGLERGGKKLFTIADASDDRTVEKSLENLRLSMSTLLRSMKARGTAVYVLMQVPAYNADPSRCARLAAARNVDVDGCSISRTEVLERQDSYRRLFAGLAREFSNLRLIDPLENFCSRETCSPLFAPALAYRDNDHLWPQAALKLLKKMDFRLLE